MSIYAKIAVFIVSITIGSSAIASPILLDIEAYRGSGDGPDYVQPTVADFIDGGVTEDLTGAMVETATHENWYIQVTSSGASGITLKSLGPIGMSSFSHNVPSNKILWNYLFFNASATTTMQISGLAENLAPSTSYSLYLWGVGDNTGQGSGFIFEGIAKEASDVLDPDTDPTTSFMVKYSFTTDAVVVADTLDFQWYSVGGNFGGLNGLAIVAPEPSSIGLIGLAGVLLVAMRRRRP